MKKINRAFKKISGIILTICLVSSSLSIPVLAAETTKSTDGRQTDLNYLYDNIKETHPNIYANTPEEEFLALKSEIESKLPSESNIDFAMDLEKLAALVGDSHTSVSLGSSLINEINFYPMEIDWFDGNWYLTMTKGSAAGMIGMQVMSINGHEMNDVLKKVSPYISHDNEVKLRRQFTDMCYISDLYSCAGIAGESEPIVLSLQNKQGMKYTLSIDPIKESEINNYRYSSLSAKRRTVPPTEFDDSKYYFAKSLNNSTYYIQYNRCSEDLNYSMSDFCKDIQADFDKGNYNLVLIDLRNNGGGSDGVIAPLMLQIKQLMTEKGIKVAILVGESTFSAAIINSVEFQEMGCVLVGEKTSGSVDHFGAITSFKLPNSQYSVSVSTDYIKLSSYFDAASGLGIEPLVPDVIFPQTIDDFAAGKDTCVEKILNNPGCLKQAERNDAPLTRGRFVGKLYEAVGSPQTTIITPPFKDLFGFEWYIQALNWAKLNKIASGSDDGNFNSADMISWKEASVFMVRAVEALGIKPAVLRSSQLPIQLQTNDSYSEYVECAWIWGLLPQNADFSNAPSRADGIAMADALKSLIK